MKANGGTLVIDDFGRQRVDPRALLNRWIIPLESRVDYLTLHTGKKIEVPFELLLIFATNLNPADLVDGAFLRRMGYRLPIERPTAETYALSSVVRGGAGLDYDPGLVEVLLGWYGRQERPMSACEPRDLIERCLDICRYEERPAALTPELLELALTNYSGAVPGNPRGLTNAAGPGPTPTACCLVSDSGARTSNLSHRLPQLPQWPR